jgi:hypothetical protein
MESTKTSGRAVIHLKDYEYVARNASLDHGVVTFTGQMRVTDLTGSRLYPERTTSHKLRAGEYVDWDRP